MSMPMKNACREIELWYVAARAMAWVSDTS